MVESRWLTRWIGEDIGKHDAVTKGGTAMEVGRIEEMKRVERGTSENGSKSARKTGASQKETLLRRQLRMQILDRGDLLGSPKSSIIEALCHSNVGMGGIFAPAVLMQDRHSPLKVKMGDFG
jgi:hypothetical protein